jgi:hypothetical protein
LVDLAVWSSGGPRWISRLVSGVWDPEGAEDGGVGWLVGQGMSHTSAGTGAGDEGHSLE